MAKVERRGGKRVGAGRPKGSPTKTRAVELAKFSIEDAVAKFPIDPRDPVHSLRRRVAGTLGMFGFSAAEIGVVLDLAAADVDLAFAAERQLGSIVGRAAVLVALFRRATGEGRYSVSASSAVLRLLKGTQ
jgi:hypothetical protein